MIIYNKNRRKIHVLIFLLLSSFPLYLKNYIHALLMVNRFVESILTCVPICLFLRARSLRCIACSFRLLQRWSSHDSVVRCHLLRKCSSQLMLIRPQASLLPYDPYLPCPLPRLVGQALTRLVTVSSMCYHTSTSALSTSSSSRGFTSLRMGYLILRGASRLDAFSVYPFRTWLPGHGFGKPTGPPAVRPSRSSRTKDSSSQISCAHAG